MKIKELPIQDRPYEKLEMYGTMSLTDSELLAIILKTGSKEKTAVQLAQEVFNLNNNLNKGLEFLNDLTIYELTQIKGIGKVKALQLKALGELLFRRSNSIDLTKIQVNSPDDIAKIMINKLEFEKTENLIMIMLNAKNYVEQITTIAKGGNSFVEFPKNTLISKCLKNNCQRIILVHNHPSGDPTPSKKDIEITQKLDNMFQSFNIDMLDHIVIGKGTYKSIKREIINMSKEEI